MNQGERRKFLIRKLLQENARYWDVEIPAGEEEQRQLLRGLMNVRLPVRSAAVIGGTPAKTECELLAGCYRSCLKLAAENNLESVAFCCISTGEFHFPNKLAAQIAVDTVDRYLSSSAVERVVFNVFKEEDENIYRKLFQ